MENKTENTMGNEAAPVEAAPATSAASSEVPKGPSVEERLDRIEMHLRQSCNNFL